MRPATLQVPKLMLPVRGVPFADWQLRWMRNGGVTEVVYCIGHLGSQIRDYVGTGERWGIRAVFSEDGKELRGTAGALRLAYERDLLADTFAITYGDSFLRTTVDEVMQEYDGRNCADALMVVFKNANRFDRSNVDFRSGWVRRYVPSGSGAPQGDLRFIDYGLSVVSRALMSEIEGDRRVDLPAVFAKLSEAGRLAGMEVGGRFFEIGSPSGLGDLEAWLENEGLSGKEWGP